MPELITASEVEQVIRKYLEGYGCKLSSSRKWGETGADIIATRGKSTWHVEIIGFHSNKSIRSRKFYEAFFRVVSRDRGNPNDILIIGLPVRFKNGMRQRRNQYSMAWDKLGKAFPNLQIWYADTERKTVEEYPWTVPFN
jgi:hypothetical protein